MLPSLSLSLSLPPPPPPPPFPRVPALECGEEASLWLCKLLNRQCRLAKQNPNCQRFSKTNHNITSNDTPLSLANEAQYLFISDASIQQLLGDIRHSSMEFGELTVESLAERFRPNLVLSAKSDVPAYAEEHWEMIRIGKAQFKVQLTITYGTSVFIDYHVYL